MGKKVNWTITVVYSGNVKVRSGPGMNYKQIGLVGHGWIGHCDEVTDDGWWHHDAGVTSIAGWTKSSGTDGQYLKIWDSGENVTVPTTNKEKENQQNPVLGSDYGNTYNDNLSKYDMYGKKLEASMLIKNARGVHGMPYQFMPNVDMRLDGNTGLSNFTSNDNKFGRKYSERIITRMPLLLLTPGSPDYMTTYSNDEKIGLLTYMTKIASGQEVKSPLDDLLTKSGRYFTFKFDYEAYYNHVNPMCQMGARFLGIQNKTIDGKRLDTYRWDKWTNNSLKGVLSQVEFIAFYIDSETQISESFSNSTGESMLSSKAKSLSDTAKEIKFLLGAGAGVEADFMDNEKYQDNLEKWNKFADDYLKGNQIFKNIGADFQTVMCGGKLVFPEIWNDSSFSKSYDVTIKLRTPDGDAFSWYMNIYVPLMHLVALTAPRQIVPASGVINGNAYEAPFLVRGFYKGLFSVDMGIITSLNISKGSQSSWTLDGLPTEVEVGMSIKDLYPVMAITTQKNPESLICNTVLIDYLATTCGINVNKPELLRKIDMYLTQKYNKVTSIPHNIFLNAQQALSNELFNILKYGYL